MSLSIQSSDPTARTQNSNDDDAADDKKSKDTSSRAPKDFDFQGASYASVTVPRGMIATRPSRSELKHDAQDLADKARKVAVDLRSPELAHLLVASGELGVDTVKVLKDTLDIAKSAPAAVEGSPLDIVECAKGAFDLAKDAYALSNDAKDFKAANTPEARAKVAELVRDLKALHDSASKLGSDSRKFVAGF